MNQKRKNVRYYTKKTVLSAMFAALVCVATFSIKIPIPVTNGYVHMGDSIVLACGILLGPIYGSFAAAVGSMLADIIGGYPQFAFPTFVIKGLMALSVALIYRAFPKKIRFAGKIFGGIVAVLLMAGGYFITEAIFMSYGFGAAVLALPFNLLQGLFGLVTGILITEVIRANKYMSGFLNDFESERKLKKQ